MLQYFDLTEFDSADMRGSGHRMDHAFLLRLDAIRHQCGFPFTINSGYRSPEHNRRVGGGSNSAHLRGLAVDVSITNAAHRYKIIDVALKAGITRIGIHPAFIHLDADMSLPQNVIWFY